MATTPGSPVVQGLKNFWQRPEGTVGKVVLVLGGIAAAYGFVQVLPFLIAAATDTLHLAILIGAILLLIFIVTDKRVLTLGKLIFQSVMRYLTGLFIELDPIGILKNYIAEMKKNLAIMDEQLGNLNGSIRTLQNQIDTNQKEAEHSMALANQADKKMSAGGLTSLDQQQYMSAKVTNQRHAASLININKSLTDLRDKLKILYDQLIRWRATAEFQVTDKENRVSEEEMRRKALKKAYSVFQAAKKIFRGDPVANQIYDQTLEYLANDAGQMLGEMEDFNRLANKLMTNMDLETGAIVEPAPFPDATTASVKAPLIRTEIWAWNAQMNYIYANGGPETTRNSLMEKHGANLKLIRQDDTSQMQNDFIACAKELHDGASQCSAGANYVLIMGDGSGQFFAAVNPQLKKLDNGAGEYIAQVIGSTGYSRGEDKLMGAPQWKADPQEDKGGLVAGVLHDDDWDIAMKWAGVS